MDLKDRIKLFIDSVGLSIREFERVCGLARGNISNMTGALGSDKLAKIIDTYPELNLYWLVAGEGEMIRDEQPAPAPTPVVVYERDPRDIELIATQKQLIAVLQREHGSGGLGVGSVPTADYPSPTSTQHHRK